MRQYDDVMNKQRELIYSQRNQVLDGVDMDATIRKMITDSIADNVTLYCAGAETENWNMAGLTAKYAWLLGETEIPAVHKTSEVVSFLTDLAIARLDGMEAEYGKERLIKLEHKVLIMNVDLLWMDHIDAMDQLKRGIGLRAYAQHDPVVAYRQEGFEMFEEMSNAIRENTVQMLLTVRIRSEEELKRTQTVTITATSGADDGSEKKQPVKKGKKVGRNDPCPCGSGKKYKQCCGR